MTYTYRVEGMTCNGCRLGVEKQLKTVPGVAAVDVDLSLKTATVETTRPVPTAALRAALPEKFTLAEPSPTPPRTAPAPSDATPETAAAKSKLAQLRPLFLILGYLTTASILMHRTDGNVPGMMLDFMGLFFVVFAFFKLLDPRGFAESFRMYDPLAQRLPLYARVYPFLETALGLMFLFRWHVPVALVLTLIVLGITTVGVTRTLLNKRAIRCACLGTALNLPMTEATFIENALMLVMAVLMLVHAGG